MSRMLSELLGAAEPAFTINLRNMEQAAGRPSVDVRLSAEITLKVQQKIRELGLDPKDTTGKELYHALQGLTKKHDEFLAKVVGGTDPSDARDLLPKIKTAVEKQSLPKNCWAIKYSVAKRLLKNVPPKRLMKQLGYKSIDSMLKRENLAELFGAIRVIESSKWLTKFIKTYKNLRPGDFEKRNIEIILLTNKRWEAVLRDFVYVKRHNVTYLKELGVIVILPLPVKRFPGLTITLFPLLLHYINEIRLYSALFKLQQVKPHFGALYADILLNDPSDIAVLAGQPIHWRVVHRYFGKRGDSSHPSVFEPHVQPEDLYWRKAEETLYRLEPALKFWEDMDYVGAVHERRPVSLNLMDNAINYCNGLPFGKHTAYHLQNSLWNELQTRYMGTEPLEDLIVKQLDEELIEPDLLTLAHEEAA